MVLILGALLVGFGLLDALWTTTAPRGAGPLGVAEEREQLRDVVREAELGEDGDGRLAEERGRVAVMPGATPRSAGPRGGA